MNRWLVASAVGAFCMHGAVARAEPKGLAAWDDARGCVPLDGGGVAVATGAGLAIVDGAGAVRTLTAQDGLPESRVHAVAAEGDALWVGTEAGAARVARSGAGLAITRRVGTAPVHAALVTNDAVWLGAWGEGLVRVSGAGTTTIAGPNGWKKPSAIDLAGGAIHVAFADGGVARLEGGALRAVPADVMHAQAIAGAGSALFASDLAGLRRLGRPELVSSVDARGLAVTNGGELLVATWGGGLLRGKVDEPKLEAVAGPGREARFVAVRGAARCVATTAGTWLDAGRGTFAHVAIAARNLPSNDVTALAAGPGGRVAIGTFERGAVVADGDRLRRVSGVAANDTVNALAWEGERLWVGTAHGLVRVERDGASRRFSSRDGLPSSFVRAILLDGARVVVGTDDGPAAVEGDVVTPLERTEKGRASTLASPMHATWALAKRPDGTLLVGTTSGLYAGKDGRWTRASVSSGALDDDWVTAIALDGSDVLVGSYAHGVTRLRADFGLVARLGGGYVNAAGLRVEGPKLFAATMDGLLARDLASPNAAWETLEGAAPGRDVTATALASGTLWVASRRGIGITPR